MEQPRATKTVPGDQGPHDRENPLEARPGDAALRDGSTVRIRSMHADDRNGLVAFFEALSEDSRRRRFFNAPRHLEGPLLDHLLDVDHDISIALVAERDTVIIGVGRANRLPGTHDSTSAEVAFAVRDDLQGLGIGTLLLEGLASRARVVGITRFVAVTQADNGSMIRVFREVCPRAQELCDHTT